VFVAAEPDTTDPSVSITSPLNGSTVIETINVDVNATDNVGVSYVELYVDGTFFASDTSSPYQFAWDTTLYPNGLYALMARAYDIPGNSADSADVVVDINNPPDTTPPTISNIQISDLTYMSATVTWDTDEPAMSATVTWDTDEPADGWIEYGLDANYGFSEEDLTFVTSHSMTLTALNADTLYHFRINSADSSGNPSVSNDGTFVTSAAPRPPEEGPGGPILIISTASNPFSTYYAEILRTEGFNAFTVAYLSSISSATLDDYDIVILGEMPLSSAQVTMFGDWVDAGGNLIAMRPDKGLADLLGLTDQSSTLANAYLLVDTSAEPSAGIVDQTIQFHGVADIYTVSDASILATLYSDATTATSNPAVTLRNIGTNGGQAAAFTYDLARSVVYTRQGNPAWAGQNRDGVGPIRSNDLFFGAASFDPQPNWIDLDNVAIPQADEQQRFLANLILYMNFDKKPLPRFWYFPRGEKAVVIMTGDDHGRGGTAGRFDNYIANSPAAGVVDNWECIRSSSYIYPDTPITDQQVAAYTIAGFDIGLHVLIGGYGCQNWTTPSELDSDYDDQLASLSAAFPSLPPPSSVRTHCVVWSDYVTQPKVELNHGIRLDTNYYYWPSEWAADRPGLFTGSGMPMRFADVNGAMIDVYQAATQMTDESGQSYPFTIDTLLDRALGPEGYYGAFTANMHTDNPGSWRSEAIVNSALSRDVPIVSGRQMLEWLDGRDTSYFDSIVWDGNSLDFTVTVGVGANGLQVMLPATTAAGALINITHDGNSIPYTIETIKGVGYAFSSVVDGAYQAVYGTDITLPVISNVTADSITYSSATVMWDTDEGADGQIEYGTVSGSYPNSSILDTNLVTSHSIPLSGLDSNTTYFYRVTSADQFGNVAVSDEFSFATPAVQTGGQTILTTQSPEIIDLWTNPSFGGEQGVRFFADVDGYITAIRFWKSPSETGLHTGTIWDSSGQVLTSVTFENETVSGWQEQALPAAFAITANTEYLVSVNSGNGYYVITTDVFDTEIVNGNLHAIAGGNGRYGPAGTYPTRTYSNSNYFRDIVLCSKSNRILVAIWIGTAFQ
jgi:hypothetical protein